MLSELVMDVKRELKQVNGGPVASAYVALTSTSIHALFLYRIMNGTWRRCGGNSRFWRLVARPLCEPLYRVANRLACGVKGIEIPYSAEIGGGLRLVHPFNIVLAPQTKLGENCTIFNGVTVGANHLDRSGYPRIGNDVVLYPGCKVVGNVTVEDTVVVGPNSVVVKDIARSSIVSGIPAVTIGTIDSSEQLKL